MPLPLLAAAPEGVTVKPITNEQGIAHFLSLKRAIWDQLCTTREFLLSMLSDPLQRDLAFVAYFAKKPRNMDSGKWPPPGPRIGPLDRERSRASGGACPHHAHTRTRRSASLPRRRLRDGLGGRCDAATKDDNNPGNINPEQQCHDCAKDSVKRIEIRKSPQIPSEESMA